MLKFNTRGKPSQTALRWAPTCPLSFAKIGFQKEGMRDEKGGIASGYVHHTEHCF